ncbi:MAG: HPP family protein [Rubrivivax sp.]
MGASAVLLFAVPSSPLAQPWPVMVGNVMSAPVVPSQCSGGWGQRLLPPLWQQAWRCPGGG